MKVVIAPDKFAGTLGAADAAEAIAAGWRRRRRDDEIVIAPMADGGEGTLEVVATGGEAERRDAEVADARGRATRAQWLRLPDGRALVEAAQAVGLSRLAPDQRDPLAATSYGVGQMLRAAADDGAEEVLVALGGSATVDGGAGAALALGHRLLRADGNGVKVGAAALSELDRVLPGPPLSARVTVACDVTNPLLGPRGAARVFGPQKGADPAAVASLEARLARWADVVERDVAGGPWRDLPGAGAAGGLAFGLAALAGARLRDGAAAVAGLVGLDAALSGADVVVIGEGSMDDQTLAGKAPAHVAERARRAGARVVAIAGRVSGGATGLVDIARELGPAGLERPAERCREEGAELAGECAARWAQEGA